MKTVESSNTKKRTFLLCVGVRIEFRLSATEREKFDCIDVSLLIPLVKTFEGN